MAHSRKDWPIFAPKRSSAQIPSAPAFVPPRQLWRAQRLWLSAAIVLGVGGCSQRDFAQGLGSDCEPGTLECVCDRDFECEAPLECRRDLCVAPELEGKQDEANSAAPEAGKEPSQEGSGAIPKSEVGNVGEKKMGVDSGANGDLGPIEPNDDSGTGVLEPDTVPRCRDSIQNGDESDVDCGGNLCLACTLGLRCEFARDCFSDWCFNGRCSVAPGSPCQRDQQCEDHDPCTQNRCLQGICRYLALSGDESCELDWP